MKKKRKHLEKKYVQIITKLQHFKELQIFKWFGLMIA